MIFVLFVLALVVLMAYKKNNPALTVSQISWINGTQESDLKPQIKRILPTIVLSVNAAIQNHPTIYMTSTTGGVHMYRSLHPEGLALDFDIVGWSDSERSIVAEKLDTSLGYGYDVVDEGTHIHVEFDPK